MGHIFISYSRDDLDFARYLRALLESAGYPVWMDEKRLSAGMDWWDEIEESIDECGAFVVVMSPTARESVFVRNEILRALDREKPLFPVLLAGEGFGMLAHVQYEDMRAGLNGTLSAAFLDNLQRVIGQQSSTRQVRFEIVNADVREFDCDVLVFKYAKAFHGADLAVARQLRKVDVMLDTAKLKAVGEHEFVDTAGAVTARQALYIGTPYIAAFGYREIREFATDALGRLATLAPNTRHVAMTIHGVRTHLQLDEGETLLAQIAGLVDALSAWQVPSMLERISIVEWNEDRTARLQDAAAPYFAEVAYADTDENGGHILTFEREGAVVTPDAGQDDVKPYALVLLPDDPELDDIFYYGMQRPVHAQGLLCERGTPEPLPLEGAEGEEIPLMQTLLARIAQARALVCDVTTITPLLYLQIGYALGREIPVAIVTRGDAPDFADEAIHYEKIWQLEERLSAWFGQVF